MLESRNFVVFIRTNVRLLKKNAGQVTVTAAQSVIRAFGNHPLIHRSTQRGHSVKSLGMSLYCFPRIVQALFGDVCTY